MNKTQLIKSKIISNIKSTIENSSTQQNWSHPNWKKTKQIHAITFLKSLALTVPSGETSILYFFPVRSSTTVSVPLTLDGGEIPEEAERWRGWRSAAEEVVGEGSRWAVRVDKRFRAASCIFDSVVVVVDIVVRCLCVFCLCLVLMLFFVILWMDSRNKDRIIVRIRIRIGNWSQNWDSRLLCMYIGVTYGTPHHSKFNLSFYYYFYL